MRVGIVILPDRRWAQAARQWRMAEEFGFDSAWTYDHIGWRDLVDGPWFDAVPVLTAAAAVTSRVRLGTMVASANFRHPVHFAREVTALDDISAGRVTLGLGAGGEGYDAAVLGLPELSPRQRVDRFAEFVTLLDRLLRDGQADAAGRYFRAVDARSTPGCVQRPRVPFVVAANGPRSMRLAARFGRGWVTTGRRGDDLAEWWRSVDELTKRFGEAEAGAGRGPGELDRLLSLDAAPVFSLSSAQFFADAAGRAAELGFTEVITHWPRADSWYAGSETVLEQVARDVLPALRSLPGPGASWS
ncbi:LLM class flavin-dependent oxidoreductase [Dactylosporangium sp. CA-092794]|uniref:LLM class flavin-dependent oxidoreductase n=1 Tax=Dactylosporangium sp. CA-092794 TaxID=3239929 RepID=UPI003D94B936